MEIIHLIIPGQPIVKKNTAKTSFTQKSRNGERKMRTTPVHYYTDAYKAWAREAVLKCSDFKNSNSQIQFPIVEKMNMKCWFFTNNLGVVDLSALYEGVQDVLCGKAGINFPPEVYKIIADDNIRYIGSHDGSRVIYSPTSAYTEIWLTPFKLDYCQECEFKLYKGKNKITLDLETNLASIEPQG